MEAKTRTRGEKNGRGACFIAVALFIACACMVMSNLWFLRNALETSGTVVSNRREIVHGRAGKQISHYAMVEFMDANGNRHQFEHAKGKDEPFPIGKTLPVLYSPIGPRTAYVGGPEFWGIPLGLGAMGLFFLLFGVALIVFSRKLVKWGVPMNT